MKQLLTTEELAVKFGLSLSTLLFYQAEGLLQPSEVGDERYYSVEDEKRLKVILKGKRIGFTLVEIKKLIEANTKAGITPRQITDELAELERKREAVDVAIVDLRSQTQR